MYCREWNYTTENDLLQSWKFLLWGEQESKDKDTAIYEQTFTFVDGVLQTDISADMIPCSISSTSERNNFQPAIAKGDRKQTIIDHMNEYSESTVKSDLTQMAG